MSPGEDVKKLLEEAYKNPILEYWEHIKHKPLFSQIERLQREIRKAEKKIFRIEPISSNKKMNCKSSWKRKKSDTRREHR